MGATRRAVKEYLDTLDDAAWGAATTGMGREAAITIPPFPCNSTPRYDEPMRLVAVGPFMPLLLVPDPGPRVVRARSVGTTWWFLLSERQRSNAVLGCSAPRWVRLSPSF